ncbi:MAG: two-component system response regulator CreB [Candidatus Thioglobus sp.]|jgi:two-component system catabolic regulation response regulator CreB
MNTKKILLIEDEKPIAEALIFSLEKDNYEVNWCALGLDALNVIQDQQIDLVILDIGLPDINGFDLCKMIKAKQDLPIIFLTARQEEVDKLIGLEIGGDDYMTKPFSLREVSSRIKVILKRYTRSGGINDQGLSYSSLKGVENCSINNDTLKIIYFDQALDLTRYEFLLFKILIESPNRVFSRDALMQNVWDEPERSFERAVDTHIKTLRAKLKEINNQVQPIKTHHGLGYSFSDKEILS